MSSDFPITERTRMRRKAKRATYDRDTIYAIFDEALIAAVSVVIDGRPQVQPMIHVRDGDSIILHGLAGNRLLGVIADGGELCLNVTMIDALALARRIEDHSMLYRSATIYGRGTQVTDLDEKMEIMSRVFESLVRSDRMASLPALDRNYLGGTMVVRVSIDDAVGKVNSAVETSEGPDGIWSGIVPVSTSFGTPKPDDRTAADGLVLPGDIASYRRDPSGAT